MDKSRYEPHLLLPAEGPLSERWRGAGLPLHILPYRGASTFFIPAIWERFPIISRITELLRHEQIRLVKSDYHTLPLIAPAAQKPADTADLDIARLVVQAKALAKRILPADSHGYGDLQGSP